MRSRRNCLCSIFVFLLVLSHCCVKWSAEAFHIKISGWDEDIFLRFEEFVCLLVGCLTSEQHAHVSPRWICTDNITCCPTEIEVADQTFYLTQSQYTDTELTSPSADPIMPGAWQGSHWSVNFEVTGMTWPGKILSQAGFEPWIFLSRGRRHNH